MADLIYMAKSKWLELLDKIRTKGGTSATMTADAAIAAVDAIETGGGESRIQIRGQYQLSTIDGIDGDVVAFENFLPNAPLTCQMSAKIAGRVFTIDFAGESMSLGAGAMSSGNAAGAVKRISSDSDPDFVLHISSGGQIFRSQSNLTEISARVTATASTADRTFARCSALEYINFAPNKCNMPLLMGDSLALTDRGLVAIANGLYYGSAYTVTLHATPKARCTQILGTVSQVTDGGETYDVFTQDSSGTVTLADFITNTKGWTLA